MITTTTANVLASRARRLSDYAAEIVALANSAKISADEAVAGDFPFHTIHMARNLANELAAEAAAALATAKRAEKEAKAAAEAAAKAGI